MRFALPRACRRARLRKIGWHALRHTFCSHLAMRGATAKAIQELAGHTDLSITLRYMHLAPAHLTDAVQLLDIRESETPFAEPKTASAENPRRR